MIDEGYPCWNSFRIQCWQTLRWFHISTKFCYKISHKYPHTKSRISTEYRINIYRVSPYTIKSLLWLLSESIINLKGNWRPYINILWFPWIKVSHFSEISARDMTTRKITRYLLHIIHFSYGVRVISRRVIVIMGPVSYIELRVKGIDILLPQSHLINTFINS